MKSYTIAFLMVLFSFDFSAQSISQDSLNHMSELDSILRRNGKNYERLNRYSPFFDISDKDSLYKDSTLMILNSDLLKSVISKTSVESVRSLFVLINGDSFVVPEQLAEFVNLKDLVFIPENFVGRINESYELDSIENIERIKGLEYINLEGALISSSEFIVNRNMKAMRVYVSDGTKLDFSHATELGSLHVSHYSEKPFNPEILSPCVKLQFLAINSDELIDFENMLPFEELENLHCPIDLRKKSNRQFIYQSLKLKDLSVHNLSKYTFELSHINFPHLETLSISHNFNQIDFDCLRKVMPDTELFVH